jgi:hypothetical protein
LTAAASFTAPSVVTAGQAQLVGQPRPPATKGKTEKKRHRAEAPHTCQMAARPDIQHRILAQGGASEGTG